MYADTAHGNGHRTFAPLTVRRIVANPEIAPRDSAGTASVWRTLTRAGR